MSTLLYRDKGILAETYFDGAGTPGGLPGNYSFGGFRFHSTDVAEGWVDTFSCDEGETPWGDENGENTCDPAGSFYAWSQSFTVASGKGKSPSSTYSGTVDFYDATTGDGGPASRQAVTRVGRYRRASAPETGTHGEQTDRDQRRADLARVARFGRWGRQWVRGEYMITATPSRQIRAPMTSYRSGRNPSRAMPQASEPATNTPP